MSARRWLRWPSLRSTAFLLLGLVGVMVAVAFGLSGVRAVRLSTEQILEQRLVLAQSTAGQVDLILGGELRQLLISARAGDEFAVRP